MDHLHLDRYADHPDGRIAWQAYGPSVVGRAGDVPPRVLLIQGFTVSGRAWRGQVEGLAGDHDVLIYDHLGVGRSDPIPDARWTMRRMVEHAAAVLDAAGWPRAHIVGLSMGGMIAQELALRLGDRVDSLTLIATQPGGRRAMLPRPAGLATIAAAQRLRGRERLRKLAALVFRPAFLASLSQEELAHLVDEKFGAPLGPRTRRRQLRAIAGHDVRARLHHLDGLPTLVVQPGDDILVRPVHSERIAQLIPGATLLQIPDAAHGVVSEHKQRVNEAIRRHIAAANGAGAR
jgi:pimeloyl-ACP methyl ester carboxylesterase